MRKLQAQPARAVLCWMLPFSQVPLQHSLPCRRFDLLTGTWYMYPPESTAPPLLHAAAVRISANAAVVFGGMDDQRQTSGAVYLFAVGRGLHARARANTHTAQGQRHSRALILIDSRGLRFHACVKGTRPRS